MSLVRQRGPVVGVLGVVLVVAGVVFRSLLPPPAVLEQWAAALCTPSMQRAHMECSGPHTLGTEFLRNVIEESIRVWYAVVHHTPHRVAVCVRPLPPPLRSPPPPTNRPIHKVAGMQTPAAWPRWGSGGWGWTGLLGDKPWPEAPLRGRAVLKGTKTGGS